MDETTPLDGTEDEEIIEDAHLRFDRCVAYESEARKNFRDDIRFAEGDSRNQYQWPEQTVNSRGFDNKPCLTNNLVRQHNLQICNDATNNKPGIEIRAVGDGATYEAAKVFEGLCRHIEYQSSATVAYQTATYNQVYGGIGYWRVVTDYADENSFDLDIFIRRISDAMSVYLDPDITFYDGSDAKFGFVFTDMERRAFNKMYPEFADSVGTNVLSSETHRDWAGEHHVRVAEYYRKVEKADYLIALPDGTTVKQSELPVELRQQAKELGFQRRKVTRTVIEQYKIAGKEILSRAIWPGKYIPIVRVVGEETVIDGVMDRKGHTRAMISAQQMHNYFYSAAVEHVALQGKTPWVGPAAAFEGYETFYENANKVDYAWLPHNAYDDQGRAIPAPQRAEPPQMAQAFIQGLTVSSTLIMDVSGQHQANMGEASNEKSGVAIQQRQRQGDTATAHYIDHQAQAIRFTGRILIDLIPLIYDTTRVTHILNEDGSQQRVQVDPNAPEPHQQVQDTESQDYDPNAISAIFNPAVGKYSVVAEIGPSYATKRQDAFAAFSQIMQNNQEAMKIGGDLMWKNADFPGADDLAARWRRSVPQNLLSDGPPPEVAQLQQQLSALKQEAEHRLVILQQKLTEAEQKLKNKDSDIERQNYEAETRRLATVASVDPAAITPIIRQLVSEVLQTPIVPVMAAHAAAEQAMLPPDPSQMPATSGPQTGQPPS